MIRASAHTDALQTWATLAAVTAPAARVLLLLVAAVAAALVASGPADAFSKQDVTITSADGTALAATLTLPDGAAPAGGWPAVIFMHGLGGNRSSTLAAAQQMGIGDRFAVLAYDARGHGQSGGLIGIDGPKEIADVKAVFAWLRDRPDVADTRIGGWGVSYGGGAAWNVSRSKKVSKIRSNRSTSSALLARVAQSASLNSSRSAKPTVATVR